MGGDNAPGAMVEGAVIAAESLNANIVLVGKGEEILKSLRNLKIGDLPSGIEIADAPDVISMRDDPTAAIRSMKNSSMVVALNMLKDGGGDALLSAGSTGALLAGSTLILRRISGVRRAALAPIMPAAFSNAILIDCGANVDCSPEMLRQFAYMGGLYAKLVLGKSYPRIGLLNNGTEEGKGPELQRDTYRLLEEDDKNGKINFVGNIEARDIFDGAIDVIVSDGFSGNILLKTIEGMGMFTLKTLKSLLTGSKKVALAGLMLKDSFAEFKRDVDYTETGGAVLLGVTKPVIKAHGSSNGNAAFNAIRQAVTCARSGYVDAIAEMLRNRPNPDNFTNSESTTGD
jgi:glycerol-3-phosphate acyltransferase PlsX